MPEGKARLVAAATKRGKLRHAIWVDRNTEPFQYYMSGTAEGIRRSRLATGQIREGLAECGAFLPTIVAGSQGGHDWDRFPDDEKCLNCRRALGEIDVGS